MKLAEMTGEPSSDAERQALIGKTLIAGLAQFDPDGELLELHQACGTITGFENGRVVVRAADGQTFRYPYAPDAIVDAPRGEYTLRSTGQKVRNPDYLLSWRVDLAPVREDSEWTPDSAPFAAPIVPQQWDFEYAYDPGYLQRLIATRGDRYRGKTVLVGISNYTVQDGHEALVNQVQFYGTIARVSFREGIVIALAGGTEYKLPPDLTMIQRARRGEYRLRSTGEVVRDPDYITTWSATASSR